MECDTEFLIQFLELVLFTEYASDMDSQSSNTPAVFKKERLGKVALVRGGGGGGCRGLWGGPWGVS
jgi:hypothetical protein